MLPKPERLKDKYLLNTAFKLGRTKKQKLNSSLFALYYLFRRNNINNLPKTAFIAPLVIDKRSNKRNLIKRRMRAAYILIKNKLINTNKNSFKAISVLIWVANPEIKNATFEQIKNTMYNLLTKLTKETENLKVYA